MAERITFSIIKTDTGSYVRYSSIHPELVEAAQQHLSSAVEQNLLIDGEIAASASTQKLSLIARKYVGKDAPVLVTHCQSGLPTAGQSGGRLSAEPWTLRIPSAGTRRHGIHDDAGLDEETGRPLGKQRGRLKSEIDNLCPVPLQGAVQAATEGRQNSVQCRVRKVCR